MRRRFSNADLSMESILANNRKWVAKKNKEEPTFFTKLGQGQSPKFLYIGCSDAKGCTSITGLELGSLFVHRNLGNLVVPCDLNLLSALTYAVDHLKVRHILVVGHYDCTAIKAAVKRQELGVMDNWFSNIRDVWRMHREELDAIECKEAFHRRLVELNVH